MTGFFAQSFRFADREVGEGAPCLIIAEAGVAHFGDLDKALRLVDMAADAGADAVKFQLFQVDTLIASSCREWRDRLGSRRLEPEQFRVVRERCVERGIPFFATAHDEPSLDALDVLDVPAYKIGSGEVRNWDFIHQVASRGKPVILSTGMYRMDDVERAVEAVAQADNPDLALLHCVTIYPTSPEEVNLRAMDTLAERFGVVAGYSDHTQGIHFPLAAVARGAKILEKHISLDFDVLNAQDWKVSCDMASLASLVDLARQIEVGLGHGRKEPGLNEARSLEWARKSLVAARAIPAGTCIAPDMLAVKRPGTGIPPDNRERVVGRVAVLGIEPDTIITWDMLG